MGARLCAGASAAQVGTAHYATGSLRAAARERGDTDAFNLWAGQAHELAEARPPGEIVLRMGEEARRAIEEVRVRVGGRS
jgi:nitronate monooxygenase